MPMDPQLAAIYGTNQDESDVEKLAAAELAGELAEGEEKAELTDEEAEALAQQILADESGEGAEVEEEEQEGAAVSEPDEAQEKLSEADYLGRVMAHAYAQELRKIAAFDPADMKKVPLKHRASGAARAAGKWAKGKAQAGWSKAKEHGGKAVAHVKAHPKSYAGGAAGLALAGGGAAYLHSKKGKKKHSAAEGEVSALDLLAERRAMELLAESGIDISQETPETEKTSASEEQMTALQAAVEERAVALLQANGYVQAEEQAEE